MSEAHGLKPVTSLNHGRFGEATLNFLAMGALARKKKLHPVHGLGRILAVRYHTLAGSSFCSAASPDAAVAASSFGVSVAVSTCSVTI